MINLQRMRFIAVLLMGSILVSCSGWLSSPSTVEHTVTPPASFFSQVISDCNTGDLVGPSAPIQPNPGCDSWSTNRYERPFNAQTQDEFYPDLDILGAELGEANGWLYARIVLFDLREGEAHPQGVYAIEMDLDMDNRGDALVLAKAPSLPGEQGWSTAGVQVWEDTDQTVGNLKPSIPDLPFEGIGYDKLLFDEGEGGDPDLAWSRFFQGEFVIVELAFKSSLINQDDEFKWWVWADQNLSPEAMDYHDSIDHQPAGDAYEDQPYFPVNEIYQVDNTCKALWDSHIDDSEDPALLEDASLCINDPNVPPPPPPLSTPTPDGRPSITPTSTKPGGPSATPTPTKWTPTPTGTFITFTATPTGWTPSPTPTPTRWTVTPTPTSTRQTATPTPTPTRWTATPTATTERVTPTPTSTRTPRITPTPTTPTDCPFGAFCD